MESHLDPLDRQRSLRMFPRSEHDAGLVIILIDADEFHRNACAILNTPLSSVQRVFTLIGPAAFTVSCHRIHKRPVHMRTEINRTDPVRIDLKNDTVFCALRFLFFKDGISLFYGLPV